MSMAQNGDVRWLVAVSLGLASIQLAYNSYPAALPLIREEWSMTNAAAGLIQASFYGGYLLAVVLILPLTDRRILAKYVWPVAVLVTSLSNMFFPLFADGVVSAMVWRAAAGFGTVCVYMPGVRLIVERFSGSRRGAPLGIYLSSFGLAGSISFALTGGMIPHLGWRGAYVLAGAIGFAGLLPAWYVFRSPVPSPPLQSQSPPASMTATFTHRPLLLAVLAYAVHNWELIGMKAWIAPFLAMALMRQGESLTSATSQGAILTAVLSIAGAIAMAFTGRVSDNYGRTATASTIMVIAGVCSFTIGWLMDAPFWILVAISMVYGITVVAESPIITTMVTELAPPGRLGAAQASQSFLGNITSLLAPFVFGAILDLGIWGGWGLAFSTMGLGALAGIIFLMGLRSRKESLDLAGGKR